MYNYRLPSMHGLANDVGRPLLREHQKKGNPKAEEIHVQYAPVMISVVGTTMPRQAFLDTWHIGMEALQFLVQPVLGAAADHDIDMLQLMTTPLEELMYHHNHGRVHTNPSGL